MWSLALANRLVGNPEGAAALETSGLVAFDLAAPAMVAVVGAMVDVVVDDGPPMGWGMPTSLPAGAVVRLGAVRDGLRSYIAVRGGLRRVAHTADVTCTGPSRSSRGDVEVLDLGPDPGTSAASEAAAPQPPASVLHVWPGPRLDWLESDAWQVLTTREWVVQPDSNRIGARLAGPALARKRAGELPSEGLVEGAVQVPPDGQPIVMLADHPTTGGYPVIAVVDPAHVRHVAQSAPGTTVRFRPAR